ncbi:MAG: deoxyribonuclease IV [Mycoplasma sp.]|nr:deoxyribonuclease IV [Mycoplasma sp.]
MNKIGAHVSFSKAKEYLKGAAEESISWGANSMMIYVGAPQSTKRVDVNQYNLDFYQENYKTIIPPERIIVHAPYIINPANLEKSKFAAEFLIKEIERTDYIGSKYIVVHPGAHLKFNKNESILECAKTFNTALSKTKNVSILIETMSGKGSEIGVTFEEVQQIIDSVDQKDRIGVCLDTCHVWEAGYDLNDFDNVLNEFDRIIGIDKLLTIHLNDSKNDIGAHKDRHENIGKGKIGFNNLKYIFDHPKLENVVKILETPWVDGKPIYKSEIEMLLK